jgi:spermidine/putrescine transport system permease protein
MKSSGFTIKLATTVYLLVFFSYLLGPLLVMSVTAFNSPGFPSASPWECLTFEWFRVLYNDARIMNGIKNSLIIGLGTVTLSVAMGLAGALVLTQIWPKLRSTYYTIIIAPILVPGVVLGISTLVFWDRINMMLGLSNDSVLHNGIFLTIIGQSSFIASYCLLVFVARLQRFDPGLTEAALDLGATQAQAFRKVLLPFLAPAVASAAVLAFLASFENYNTTTFTFGKYPTLTIELAQKVRYGINPSISALAFIIVVLTVLAALTNEVRTRRKQVALANGAPESAVSSSGFGMPKIFHGNPAAIVLAVLVVAIGGTIAYSQVYSPDVCEANVREIKQIEVDKRIEALKQKQIERKQGEARVGPDIFGPENSLVKVPDASAPSKDARPEAAGGLFGDVFNPGNLEDGASDEPVSSPGAGMFGDVFKPGNLDDAGN